MAAAALAAGLWPTLAGAGDGVLEINQSCAMHTGCFPGDAPGFPVSVSATGSYKLTGNLDVAADTTGIQITAPDVSLDLNGFSIRGGATCPGDPPTSCTGAAGNGIHSTAPGSRVFDGFVTGFFAGGVVLGDNAYVSSIEARRNGRVGVEVGARGRIRDSHASQTAGVGLFAGRDGSVLDSLSVRNADTAVVLGFATGLGDSVMVADGQTEVVGGVLLGGNACSASPMCTQVCTDGDGDGAFADCRPLDCDDAESQSFPGNSEVCDGIDNDCNGLVDDACGPVASIDFCKLEFPADASVAINESITFFGRVFAPGITDQTSAVDTHPDLVANVGFGPDGTDPVTSGLLWSWIPANPNSQWDDAVEPGNDEYQGDFFLSDSGEVDVAYRFSADAGATWTYCDLGPEGSSDGYSPATAGSLRVGECTDLAAPASECGPSLQCQPDLDGSAFCSLDSGLLGVGALCSTAGDCQQGLGCINVGGGIMECRQWCVVSSGTGCSFGTCSALTPSITVAGVEWGVCI